MSFKNIKIKLCRFWMWEHHSVIERDNIDLEPKIRTPVEIQVFLHIVKQYLLKLFLPGQQNQILCLPNHLVLYSTVKGQNPFEISEKNLVTSVRMSEYLANEHSWGEFYHNFETSDRNVSVTQVCQNKTTEINKRKKSISSNNLLQQCFPLR